MKIMEGIGNITSLSTFLINCANFFLSVRGICGTPEEKDDEYSLWWHQ